MRGSAWKPNPGLEVLGGHPAGLQGPALLSWRGSSGDPLVTDEMGWPLDRYAGVDLGSRRGKRDSPEFSQAFSHLLTGMTRDASLCSD